MKTQNPCPLKPWITLLESGILQENEELLLDNGLQRFRAKVTRHGLKLGKRVYSPSYAANLCMNPQHCKPLVNGWQVWKNLDGKTLSELYAPVSLISNIQQPIEKQQESLHFSIRKRNAVFFLGAGVSIADGAPLQKDIIPLILDQDRKKSVESPGKAPLTRFLMDWFACTSQTREFPPLEQVFGFIDYFLTRQESLNGVYTCEYLLKLREELIHRIHHAVRISASRSSSLLERFWVSLFQPAYRNVSVVSVNYDTLTEDAFQVLFPLNAYLDYCLPLANYDYFHIHPEDWWINPREPLFTPEGQGFPVRFKYIKLHGSMNWYYCNCCNSLIIKPWEVQDTTRVTHRLRCGRDHNLLKTMLIPPSWNKNLLHPIILQLFNEAAEEIRQSRKVIFIGYSLPEADVHIKAMLSKCGMNTKELWCINPDTDARMERQFLELSPHCTFIRKTFGEMLDSGELDHILKQDTS